MSSHQIKNLYTGAVLYETEADTLADAVAKAVASRAHLRGANLRGANLQDANLQDAYLQDANLRGANLQDANLQDANLQGANLQGANLQDANLQGANLQGANLQDANLQDAYLPAPTVMLLAYWPDLSPQLVADLMLFDADNHPDPEAFARWVAGGACPYDGVHVGRAAYFDQDRALWGTGQHCRPYDLMARAIAECCPEWSAERVAEFAKRFETQG
jgi:hypothetical protein